MSGSKLCIYTRSKESVQCAGIAICELSRVSEKPKYFTTTPINVDQSSSKVANSKRIRLTKLIKAIDKTTIYHT